MTEFTKVYKNIILTFSVYFYENDNNMEVRIDVRYLSYRNIGKSIKELEKEAYEDIDELIEEWESLKPGKYRELTHALNNFAVEGEQLDPVATEIIVKNFIKRVYKIDIE